MKIPKLPFYYFSNLRSIFVYIASVILLYNIEKSHLGIILWEGKLMKNTETANVGDVVLFDRRNQQYEGKVFQVRENSVLVELSKDAAKVLGYEMPNTVVRHGKYSIIS